MVACVPLTLQLETRPPGQSYKYAYSWSEITTLNASHLPQLLTDPVTELCQLIPHGVGGERASPYQTAPEGGGLPLSRPAGRGKTGPGLLLLTSPRVLELPATSPWFVNLDRSWMACKANSFSRVVTKVSLLKRNLVKLPSPLFSPDAQTCEGNRKRWLSLGVLAPSPELLGEYTEGSREGSGTARGRESGAVLGAQLSRLELLPQFPCLDIGLHVGST